MISIRRIVVLVCLAAAAVVSISRPCEAQLSAPRLKARLDAIDDQITAATNGLGVANLSSNINDVILVPNRRTFYAVNLKSSTTANATNIVDLIDQTDGTTNTWASQGLATNVLGYVSMYASPGDNLVISTNRSTAGTGVTIISIVRKSN